MTAYALTLQSRLSCSIPCSVRRGLLMLTMLLLAVVHPIVHGTPLDGGTWDGFVSFIQNRAMTHTDED